MKMLDFENECEICTRDAEYGAVIKNEVDKKTHILCPDCFEKLVVWNLQKYEHLETLINDYKIYRRENKI